MKWLTVAAAALGAALLLADPALHAAACGAWLRVAPFVGEVPDDPGRLSASW